MFWKDIIEIEKVWASNLLSLTIYFVGCQLCVLGANLWT